MFSVTVQYALRALVELGCLPTGEALIGRELAARTGIGRDYLAKILGTLRNAKLVSASPGIGGGYRLAKAPEAIALIDAVRLLDGEQSLPQCLLDHAHPCADENPCSAHALWAEVRERYLVFLETTTIAAISRAPGAEEIHEAIDAERFETREREQAVPESCAAPDGAGA